MTRADSKEHPLLYCRLFMNNKTETIGTIDPIQAQVALRSRLDQPRVTKVKYGQEIIELDLREKILKLGLDLRYRQVTVGMQEDGSLVRAVGKMSYREFFKWGKKQKTDRRDSCQLTDDLDRYLRGNPKAFSVVGVPSEEQEEKRALIRYHLQIMEDRGHCGRHE